MKSDPICFKHQEVLSICSKLLDLDFDEPFKQKLKQGLKKIIKLTEQAKDDGQNMEDRLQEYYDAIEEIGFKRTKK
jgi:hypothetical protein